MHSYSPVSSLETLGSVKYSPGGNTSFLSLLRQVIEGRGSPEALQKDSSLLNSMIVVFIGGITMAGGAKNNKKT